jgi:hypothetical protein
MALDNKTLLKYGFYFIILILIIAIIVVPDMFKNNVMLNKFLNNDFNCVVLVIIIILVVELCSVAGMLLLFLVSLLIVMVRFQNKPTLASPTPSAITINLNPSISNSNGTINNISSNLVVPGFNPSVPVRENFVRDRVPVYPGLSLEVRGEANPNYDTRELPTDFQLPQPITIEKFTCASVSLDDMPTQQQLKSVDGYDIAGCRYDNKNCAQNTSINGMPLSDCRVYDVEQAKDIGCIFYPMNG